MVTTSYLMYQSQSVAPTTSLTTYDLWSWTPVSGVVLSGNYNLSSNSVLVNLYNFGTSVTFVAGQTVVAILTVNTHVTDTFYFIPTANEVVNGQLRA